MACLAVGVIKNLAVMVPSHVIYFAPMVGKLCQAMDEVAKGLLATCSTITSTGLSLGRQGGSLGCWRKRGSEQSSPRPMPTPCCISTTLRGSLITRSIILELL